MPLHERTPYHFRPMDELTHTDPVEMALRETGEVVTGWLFRGDPHAARTFWMRGERGMSKRIDPIGWREEPTPAVIAAWKATEKAA